MKSSIFHHLQFLCSLIHVVFFLCDTLFSFVLFFFMLFSFAYAIKKQRFWKILYLYRCKRLWEKNADFKIIRKLTYDVIIKMNLVNFYSQLSIPYLHLAKPTSMIPYFYRWLFRFVCVSASSPRIEHGHHGFPKFLRISSLFLLSDAGDFFSQIFSETFLFLANPFEAFVVEHSFIQAELKIFGLHLRRSELLLKPSNFSWKQSMSNFFSFLQQSQCCLRSLFKILLEDSYLRRLLVQSDLKISVFWIACTTCFVLQLSTFLNSSKFVADFLLTFCSLFVASKNELWRS